MKTRLYSPDDYDDLVPWWLGRWGNAPSLNALPLSGIIVENDGIDLAAGWLYLDLTSSTALLAFIVTNHVNSSKTSALALKILIGGLIELALSQGRTIILAACPMGSLARLFQSCGFESRDQNIEHLTLNLTRWQPE